VVNVKKNLILCAIVIGIVGAVGIPSSASYPVVSGYSITGGGATLTVPYSGQYTGCAEIDYGADRYLIATAYSASRSNSIVGHYWTWNSEPYDSDWSITVSKTGSTITVKGSCSSYTVTRSLYWSGDKFAMSDTIQSKSTTNIAIETYYWTVMAALTTTNKSCIAGLPFDYTNTSYTHQVMGCNANPTIFMQQAHSSLGMVVEDDVYRQQMFLTQGIDTNQSGNTSYNETTMVDQMFGMAPNTTYTYLFSLYPGGAGHDYWKFINTLRKDWGVNYTLHGLLQSDQHLDTAGRMFQLVTLTPWFRNQDGAGVLDSTFANTEEGYISMAMNTINNAPSTDPVSLCKTPKFMCKIESNLISINTTTVTNGSTLPNNASNLCRLLPLTTAQTSTVKANANCMQWTDSLTWINSGKTQMAVSNCYEQQIQPYSLDTNLAHWFDLNVYHAAKPSVWPVKGTNWQSYALTDLNNQAQYMKSQIDYTLDYCMTNLPANCSKGVYLDDFTLFPDLYDDSSTYGNGFYWNERMDAGQWDGYTVTMDTSNTGLITGYLTDAVLVGIPARAWLLNYILNTRGSSVVTNGHPVDAETRSFHSDNCAETCSDAVPDLTHLKLLLSTGEPWGSSAIASGHLGAPMAWGIEMGDGTYNPSSGTDANYCVNHYAQVQNKYMIMCLRNGTLFQPYTNYIASSGAGSGGYGIINLQYPFTPVELHEGYLIGKEKILTAVSGTFYWNKSDHPAAPSVCKTFDVNGNANTPKGFSVISVGAQWKVIVKLQSDWYNTCAIY
jgi:hypothetical protein